MKTDFCIYIYIFGLFFSATSFSVEKGDTIVKQKLASLFFGKKNDDSTDYDIEIQSFASGSFSQPNSNEIIVNIYDKNQCHASGWAELWLVGYENQKLVLKSKIEDADWIEFYIFNIDKNDGKQEIFVHAGGGNQGSFGLIWSVYSIELQNINTLYSIDGFDGINAYGICTAIQNNTVTNSIEVEKRHNIFFRDIDNDGKKELFDKKIILRYIPYLRKYEKSNTTKIYKYDGKKYILQPEYKR